MGGLKEKIDENSSVFFLLRIFSHKDPLKVQDMYSGGSVDRLEIENRLFS